MTGRRPLTRTEERDLLAVVRRLPARYLALVTAPWFMGFRIHEILAMTVGTGVRAGAIVTKIGMAPRHLKGHYGRTRWVSVLPELEGALRSRLWSPRLQLYLTADLPLFPSCQTAQEGQIQLHSRGQAHTIIRRAFVAIGFEDDGRLATHSLRKTFARSVYANCGNDPMILRAPLGHASIGTTQKCMEVDEDAVETATRKMNFTRRPKLKSLPRDLSPDPALEAPVLTTAG